MDYIESPLKKSQILSILPLPVLYSPPTNTEVY